MTQSEPLVLRGESRHGGPSTETTVRLEATGFSITADQASPVFAAYRDVVRVGVDGGSITVRLGTIKSEPWVFERFGPHLGALARGLRDGRLRQWLADGLLEEAAREPIELVEAVIGTDRGVAQLVYHERGVALAPLDETRPRLRIRRADIMSVVGQRGTGAVQIACGSTTLELVGLGAHEESHRQRWQALRDQANADMAAIVSARLADAPFDIRQGALEVLAEGRPADREALGPAFEPLETAVLTEPDFAESYRTLVARAGGPAAPRWLSLAPARPGTPDDPIAWFLIGLPGNLVALELVSGGAHATYLFRVEARATYDGPSGGNDPGQLGAAVSEISDALIDSRFLREPMAIPDDQLATPDHIRYRLALAVLPNLARARARFVARLVHTDSAGWSAALDDLIAWHATARDEAAVWPGRSGQESAIAANASTTPTLP